MKRIEDSRQSASDGRRKIEDRLKTNRRRAWLLCLCLTTAICFLAPAVFAADDMLRIIEEKRVELKEKEEFLKREEQQLLVLKKEVDGKIEAYTRLLAQVEAALKRVEQIKGEKIENVVKAYEVMPAEDAAPRLAALDEETALLIMTRMKSKKAGAVIALMEPRKAATLTKSMTALSVKNTKGQNADGKARAQE
jgi:flagellar motility protein MotE (MotC chaperone)